MDSVRVLSLRAVNRALLARQLLLERLVLTRLTRSGSRRSGGRGKLKILSQELEDLQQFTVDLSVGVGCLISSNTLCCS
jgi:hypothetical protein